MNQRKGVALIGALGLVGLLAVPAPALGDDGNDRGNFRARLTGFQEVPAISTTGHGEFRAQIKDDTIEFELRYDALEGGNPSAAHIHLGQRGVNGGVIAFLCGGGGKSACPSAASGTVTGTITANDIQTVGGQGIDAGESDRFEEVVRAIQNGVTYANVHNSTYGGGEIRGQIGRGRGEARGVGRGVGRALGNALRDALGRGKAGD